MPSSAATFGDLVRQYISDHGLSYQDFANAMGFKSKTSISRIIQDETSYELRAQFFSRLNAQYPLTEQENQALREALRASRLSPQDQAFFRCFDSMLHASDALLVPSDIPCVSADQMQSLGALLASRAASGSLITVSVFGLPGSALITALYRLLIASSRPFSIRQYVFSGDDILPQLQSAADSAPFLFDSRYTIYCCRLNKDQAAPQNHLILRCDMPDGTSCEDVFLLRGQEPLLSSGPLNSNFTALYHGFFFPAHEPVPCLKTEYDGQSASDQLSAFCAMQEKILDLEEDCALYALKGGLTEEFIPPEIFRSAVSLQGLSPQDERKMLSRLLRIQRARHQHLLSQKKPLHYLFSQDAFRRFVWTGCMENHPSFLRPFSPKERCDTLTLLIQQLQQNPYFSVYLANENLPEIGDHLLLTGYHHTHYASSHQSKRAGGLLVQPGRQSPAAVSFAMLTDEMLASAFSQFFREELNPRFVEPTRTTLRFLYNMLEYLQSRIP